MKEILPERVHVLVGKARQSSGMISSRLLPCHEGFSSVALSSLNLRVLVYPLEDLRAIVAGHGLISTYDTIHKDTT